MDDPYMRMPFCTDDGTIGQFELLEIVLAAFKTHGREIVMNVIADAMTACMERCEAEHREARAEKFRISRILFGEAADRMSQLLGEDSYWPEPGETTPDTIT